jgi:hypothetical protein
MNDLSNMESAEISHTFSSQQAAITMHLSITIQGTTGAVDCIAEGWAST